MRNDEQLCSGHHLKYYRTLKAVIRLYDIRQSLCYEEPVVYI